MRAILDFDNKKEEDKWSNGKELIEKIYILANKLNIKNELSLCNLYSYLLHNGKLSINGDFECNPVNVKDDLFYNIIIGYGSCKNIADGLRRVLEKADVKNCVLSVAPFYKTKSNDVVNLIVTDEGYFIYDLTNMILFRLKGDFLKPINEHFLPKRITGVDTNFLGLKKSYIDAYEEKYLQKYNKIFDTDTILKEVPRKPIYTKEEYLQAYEKDISYFKKNSDLINTFYDEAYENIKGIANTLK